MNRLQQDAADSLAAYEHMQAVRNRARADWLRAQAAVMTGTMVFTPLTAKERTEREQQIKAGNLPF